VGRGGAIASSLSQNDRIEAITRSRWTPQSAPFPDLSTFGPVCGVRFYRFVTASCLQSKEHGLALEEVPIQLLGTAVVPLSKAPDTPAAPPVSCTLVPQCSKN